ncbi:TPA: hypothetical protein HA244_01985 [Candidatus Micrarchaeota archaeon]|nr:hypothetical protein [Candidatus Micrarchaeota archaeon]
MNVQKGLVCLGGCNGFSKIPGVCKAGTCTSRGHVPVPGFKCMGCGETFAESEKHSCK